MKKIFLLCICLLSCEGKNLSAVTAVEDEKSAQTPARPGDSIYNLEAKLETHSGEKVDLDLYEGHPTLVSMFYANCPMACPTLIRDVKSMEAKLPRERRQDLRVLLVSLDPERDTPELMTTVTQKHGIDTSRWTLSRTDEAKVREISGVLGISYRMLNDGEMNHSSIVTLVDRRGRIVAQVEGLGQDPEPILAKLMTLE